MKGTEKTGLSGRISDTRNIQIFDRDNQPDDSSADQYESHITICTTDISGLFTILIFLVSLGLTLATII